MKKVLTLISVSVLLLLACKEPATAPDDKDKETLAESDEILPNPFKGFVPWIGSVNDAYPTQLQYGNFTWRDLEPSPGLFNKARFEKDWGNIAQSGRKVGFRINTCLPRAAGHIDIPQWLADRGVRMRPYEIDGARGLAPDWNDPLFLQAHRDFITALGARYDSDPRIAWIDIGSYGFWGEWHVYLNDSLAASEASKQAILDAYFTAFPTKPKVIAFDDDFATQFVTSHSGGIRNDCLGTSDANNWYLTSLQGIDPSLNDRVWRTAIITGEFCGAEEGAVQGTSTRFDLNYSFIQKTHWSFIGPAGGSLKPLNAAHKQQLDRLYKKLGYRFVLRQAEFAGSVDRGGTLALAIGVENIGVAPFYFDWPVVVSLIDGAGNIAVKKTLPADISSWLPGNHSAAGALTIPEDLAAGNYRVYITIQNPETDITGIQFANKNRDTQGRALLGTVIVK